MRGGCMPHGMWGIAFFQKHSRVLGPRNGNILFINLFDAGNRHLRMGLAGKDICICLSGTPCFYQIPFQKDSAGACDYDPAGFIPFSSDCQFIQIFSLKKSLTLRSQISCALAPLAYIRFKRTWSRNPRRFSGSGSRSRTDTSLRVKIVLG